MTRMEAERLAMERNGKARKGYSYDAFNRKGTLPDGRKLDFWTVREHIA